MNLVSIPLERFSIDAVRLLGRAPGLLGGLSCAGPCAEVQATNAGLRPGITQADAHGEQATNMAPLTTIQ